MGLAVLPIMATLYRILTAHTMSKRYDSYASVFFVFGIGELLSDPAPA